ncbi:hypothetical protein ACIO6U_02870 [Streptomyces sp. NPDC087422]|uniref:hypothetical protein n=1 Tax=Streptomyces sp. NPDC087422 TaxID=3365786 RepID=UPI00382113C7
MSQQNPVPSPAARNTAATHIAPYTRETHNGPAARCTEYPCEPRREALAILREEDPRTPAEQAAIHAVHERRWVFVHADDYGTGVVLLLSRAGLLRDRAHEEHLTRAAMSDKQHRDRRRTADHRAITALTGLAAMAAGRLETGDDPAEVAAQLRDLAARIEQDREQQSSAAAPENGSTPEAITA